MTWIPDQSDLGSICRFKLTKFLRGVGVAAQMGRPGMQSLRDLANGPYAYMPEASSERECLVTMANLMAIYMVKTHALIPLLFGIMGVLFFCYINPDMTLLVPLQPTKGGNTNANIKNHPPNLYTRIHPESNRIRPVSPAFGCVFV